MVAQIAGILRQLDEKVSNFVISSGSADGIALIGARTSAFVMIA